MPIHNLQHAAPVISSEGQDAGAGNEGMVQEETGIFQETTVLPDGM